MPEITDLRKPNLAWEPIPAAVATGPQSNMVKLQNANAQSLMDPSFDDSNQLGWAQPIHNTKNGWRLNQPPSEKINPFFAMRGLENGLSWLSGKVERGRQNQYMYDQYSTMGQMDSMPAQDFQPNPYRLYSQYGGKMPKGGKLKEAIITNDPNDPRIRAYSDSLQAYNVGQEGHKSLSKYVGQITNDMDMRIIDDFNRIPNIKNTDLQSIKKEYLSGLAVNNAAGKQPFPWEWSDRNKVFRNDIYKKPVQPVVYQPEKPFIKLNPQPVSSKRSYNYNPVNPVAGTPLDITVDNATPYEATWRDENTPNKQATKYFDTLDEWKKFISDNPDYNVEGSEEGKNYATARGYKTKKFGGMKKPDGGLWNSNKKGFVDSTLNANKNLDFVKRMYEKNTPTIQVPGQPFPSTHLMGWDGNNRVAPQVVRRADGKLHYLPTEDARDEYAQNTGEYIDFKTPQQAEWFAANGYKQGTGVLKKPKGGVLPREKQSVFQNSPKTFDELAQELYGNKTTNYVPSGGVENLKKVLAGTSILSSKIPRLSYLSDVAGATGDAYTSVRHLLAGDYQEAATDGLEAVLGYLPIPSQYKTIEGLKYTPKGAAIKTVKNIVDGVNILGYKKGGLKKPDGGSISGAEKASTPINTSALNKDYDSIPDYLYYAKATQMNDVVGQKKALQHVLGIRGPETVSDLQFMGKNMQRTSLNNIAKSSITYQTNPEMRRFYAQINENPDLLDKFQYSLPSQAPSQPLLASQKYGGKMAGGGSYRDKVAQFLFEGDEDEVKQEEVEPTAPSEEEIEPQEQQQQPDDESYNMALSIAMDDTKRINRWKSRRMMEQDISLSPDQSYSGDDLAVNDRASFAYNYYQKKGLAPHQAAGIVGNLMHESQMNPGARESGGQGRGIAQWGANDRWKGLLNWANKTGKNPYDLTSQLDFVLEEPGWGQKAMQSLQSADNADQAAVNFMNTYEKPGVPATSKRVGYARKLTH